LPWLTSGGFCGEVNANGWSVIIQDEIADAAMPYEISSPGVLAVEVAGSFELNLGVVLLEVFGGGFPVDVTEGPRRLTINRADVVG